MPSSTSTAIATSAGSAVRTTADLLSLYHTDPRITRIAENLREKAARVQVGGLVGSAQALVAQAVAKKLGGTHLFVLRDKEEAAYFLNDLEALKGKEREGERAREGDGIREKKGQELYFFPAPSRTPYDPDGHHDGERVTRTEVLEMLMSRSAGERSSVNGEQNNAALQSPFTDHHSLYIVSYPEALVPLVVAKETMAKNTLTIKRGEELPIDTLEEWLHETGFHRTEFVYEPGAASWTCSATAATSPTASSFLEIRWRAYAASIRRTSSPWSSWPKR